MYFSKFPAFVAKLGEEQKVVTDFFTRVVVGEKFSKYSAYLMPYTVKDQERIEHVAYDFYRNAEFHWVIILLNGITNPREDWPMASHELLLMAEAKYGDDINSLHHKELLNGVIVEDTDDLSTDDYTLVTNLEYEIALNEAKRNIVLLDPKYLTEFVMNFENELS